MAVVCETQDAESSTITCAIDYLTGDYVVVVLAGFTTTDSTTPDPIEPDGSYSWLTEIYQGIADDVFATERDGRFAVFGGTAPADGSDVVFESSNMDWWAVNAKVFRGAGGATVTLGATDNDEKLTGPNDYNSSVGPIAIGADGSRLVYCLMSIQSSQTPFEDGPTPALPNSQLGRSIGISPPIEVGIWTLPVDAGTSATYTQTLPEGDPEAVWGATVLLCLSPDCG